MKTIIKFLLMCLLLNSCKKNYNCSCSTPFIDGSVGMLQMKDTKKKSEKKCKEFEKTISLKYQSAMCSLIIK